MDIWGTIVKSITEKKYLVLLLLGILLLIFGANAGYPHFYINITSKAWQLFFEVLGGILIVLAIVIVIMDISHLNQSAWLIKKRYGFTLDSPQIGDSVKSPIDVKGRFNKLPPDGSVFALEYNPQLRSNWPKKKITFDVKEKTWSTTMNIGGGDNKIRYIRIYYATENGFCLFDYYEKLTQKGTYLGIDKLPSDFVLLEEVKITLLP